MESKKKSINSKILLFLKDKNIFFEKNPNLPSRTTIVIIAHGGNHCTVRLPPSTAIALLQVSSIGGCRAHEEGRQCDYQLHMGCNYRLPWPPRLQAVRDAHGAAGIRRHCCLRTIVVVRPSTACLHVVAIDCMRVP